MAEVKKDSCEGPLRHFGRAAYVEFLCYTMGSGLEFSATYAAQDDLGLGPLASRVLGLGAGLAGGYLTGLLSAAITDKPHEGCAGEYAEGHGGHPEKRGFLERTRQYAGPLFKATVTGCLAVGLTIETLAGYLISEGATPAEPKYYIGWALAFPLAYGAATYVLARSLHKQGIDCRTLNDERDA
jgi:hypothetical protein